MSTSYASHNINHIEYENKRKASSDAEEEIQEKNNKETIYKNGECDFVIVWPQYGILVIECKGGGVSLKD